MTIWGKKVTYSGSKPYLAISDLAVNICQGQTHYLIKPEHEFDKLGITFQGATKLRIMTLGIMTLRIKTSSIMILRIMTTSIRNSAQHHSA